MGYGDVGRISSNIENTYGTDEVESYVDHEIVRGSMALTTPETILRNMSTVTRLHRHGGNILHGSKHGTAFQCSAYVTGLPSVLDTSAVYAHPQAGIGQILRAAMGGERGAAGSTVAGAGATTTVIPVQTGHGTRWVAGSYVAIPTTITGLGTVCEVRRVISVAGDNLTLHMALNAAPSNTTPVYNGAVYYFDPSAVGNSGNSLSFRVLGDEAEDQWLMRGCTPGSIAFKPAIDELVTADLGVIGATHSRVNTESLGTASFVGSPPVPFDSGFLWFQVVGTNTRNFIHAHDFAADLGLRLLENRSPSGIETTARHLQGRAQPTMRISTHWINEYSFGGATGHGHYVAFEAGLVFGGLLQLGTAPVVAGVGTGIVCVDFARMEYSAKPVRKESADGFLDLDLEFEADEDRGSGDATEIGRSIARVVLF